MFHRILDSPTRLARQKNGRRSSDWARGGTAITLVACRPCCRCGWTPLTFAGGNRNGRLKEEILIGARLERHTSNRLLKRAWLSRREVIHRGMTR